MGLEDVVTVNISKATSTPTRLGFGTLLLMVYHSVTTDLIATYKSVKAITDAGFPTTHPAVRMATILFSQNPRPPQVMIGKRSLPFTQTLELYPTITTVGYHYKFTVIDPAGVSLDIDYTVLVGATVGTICTALAALIDPVADVTATAAATKITVACTTGKLFNLSNLPNASHLKIKDITADPGIASDLSAIEALDGASWYAMALDYGGKATTVAAAGWIEARIKLFSAETSDTECTDVAVTNDVGSTLKTSAYDRTFTLFNQSQLLCYGGVAWLGVRLPTAPGVANWAYCTCKGVPASNLTDGQKTVLLAKKINVYTEFAGENSTQDGFVASGEWIDIMHGTDWLQARMKESIFATIKNASDSGSRIPYTDAGVDIIRAAGMTVLNEGVRVGFLSDKPEPTMSFPLVEDIDPADRANRTLPDGEFDARYANAINKTTLNGTISV